MPNIKHVQTAEDAGCCPNAPPVAEMQASQAKGATGIGCCDESFTDSLADFNQQPKVNGKELEGYQINQKYQPGSEDCPM